mgnify:CR=1 FL=1
MGTKLSEYQRFQLGNGLIRVWTYSYFYLGKNTRNEIVIRLRKDEIMEYIL